MKRQACEDTGKGQECLGCSWVLTGVSGPRDRRTMLVNVGDLGSSQAVWGTRVDSRLETQVASILSIHTVRKHFPGI